MILNEDFNPPACVADSILHDIIILQLSYLFYYSSKLN